MDEGKDKLKSFVNTVESEVGLDVYKRQYGKSLQEFEANIDKLIRLAYPEAPDKF